MKPTQATDQAAAMANEMKETFEPKADQQAGAQASPLMKRVAEIMARTESNIETETAQGYQALKIYTPLFQLETLPLVTQAQQMTVLGLEESAAAIMKPFREIENNFRADIAEAVVSNKKGDGFVARFSNEFARAAELEKQMAIFPGYLAAVAEAKAIGMAVDRLKISLEYNEAQLRNARLIYERETANILKQTSG